MPILSLTSKVIENAICYRDKTIADHVAATAAVTAATAAVTAATAAVTAATAAGTDTTVADAAVLMHFAQKVNANTILADKTAAMAAAAADVAFAKNAVNASISAFNYIVSKTMTTYRDADNIIAEKIDVHSDFIHNQQRMCCEKDPVELHIFIITFHSKAMSVVNANLYAAIAATEGTYTGIIKPKNIDQAKIDFANTSAAIVNEIRKIMKTINTKDKHHAEILAKHIDERRIKRIIVPNAETYNSIKRARIAETNSA
jgi:hypothetical protein